MLKACSVNAQHGMEFFAHMFVDATKIELKSEFE